MIQLRRAPLLLPLVLLLLGGCFQVDYEATLYPDGSGKMNVQIAIRQSALQRSRKPGRSDALPAELQSILNQVQKPERIREFFSGVVGWKPIKVDEDSTWLRATYAVYFDDINQLVLHTDPAVTGEAKRTVFSFKLIKSPAGGQTLYQITGMKGLPAFKSSPGDQAQASAYAKEIKPVIEDLRVGLRINVPGTIQESKGVLDAAGRSASWSLDGALFLGALRNLDGSEMKRIRDIMDVSESRISWTENALTPAQLEAWKKELAAAKTEWSQMGGGALSDDELERSFIKAKLSAAEAYIGTGRKDKARKILEEILQEYPKHRETLTAKAMLEQLGK
jgi:hypothetical protein